MKTINSFRSKLLALTLALMASVSTFAYEFEYVNDFHINGFAYKVLPSNTLFPYGSAALIEIADCNKDVVIPEFVSYGNTEYRIITFGMGSVVFTNDASSVVESITIPKTTSVINKNALAGCPNLKTVVVDSENPYYDSRENCNAIITTSQNPYFKPNTLIAGCKTTIIPHSVAEIGDNAFYNSALESITIPTGTTKIGRSAFNNSILLSSITLSATLIEISDWAFADCLSLNTIICYAIEPPTISSNTFFGSNPIYNNPTIYVPAESVEAYKNADQWKDFGQILPIEPTTSYKSQWCDTWNVMWFDGWRFDETASTSKYRLGKDTIIGDYTYSKFTSRTSVRFTDDRKVYVYYEGFDDNDPYTVDLPTGEYLAYDFSAQVGDTLEVFSGVHSYSKYKCLVHEVQTDPETKLRSITLFQLLLEDTDGDGVEEEYGRGEMTWIEGVGSPNGFLINTPPPGGGTYALLCAYNDDELKYTGDLYDEYGCEYNATEQKPENLFPTLWGLQRTGCTKTIGENGNGTTVWGSRSYLMQEIETATIDGKQYLLFGTNNIYDEYCSLWLREENNKILVYSTAQKKDLVLYDFTLNVGDSLSRLYVDYELSSVVDYYKYMEGYASTDPLVVTEVSTITLLDGKEYKKWTFDNGRQYVEGIGSFGTCYAHNDFYQLIADAPLYSDVYSQHLVCASKNGQLLYKMDDAEMEQLETECLCEIEPKWSETWCNQWNILSHGYQGPQDPLAGARTSIYWLSNNTVNRNGQEYIPLMCSSSMPNEESTLLVGELRFTEDKQVYFYYAFDETEYLLYDFGAELGDTLELFAGLEFYNYHKTYTHVITDKETLDDGRLQIQADVVIRIDNGAGEYFEEKHPVTWIEGLGSTYGIIFNPSNPGVAGDGAIIMLCAYRDDECVYTTNFSDYKNMGCVYNNDGTVDEDLFPMLAGLQRTVCNEFCGDTKDDNSSNITYKQTFDKILFERDQPYIYCNSAFLLREENNKILIYSHSLDKDLVLYDFTLEVGDSLPQLYLDEEAKKDIYWIYYEYMNVVDYNKYNDSIYPADTLIVTDVSMITLLDGKEYKKWTFNNGMEYVEGIGSFGNGQWSGDFFQLIANKDVPTCLLDEHLVCASKNGQLLYKMDDAEIEQLETECLCEYNTEQKPEDLFPTLWGLQRTSCDEWLEGCGENKSYLFAPKEVKEINGKLYLKCGGVFLREEDSKVLIYSFPYEKDFVLYDYTLEVGGTLQNLGIDIYSFPELEYAAVVDYIAYEDYDVETDEFIIKKEPLGSKRVTEVSTITLLDGKEYKRWLFGNDWENGNYYIEGIGSFGGDYIDIANPYEIPTCYLGERLVCVSKNNKLLYQMDDAEMERLGAECLCDYDRGPRKDNAKDGQIGGRPTPTQWNQLELDLREMDNGTTILRAETFSYTLENDSVVANDKIFYQLARQSTKDTATTKSFVGALHFGKDEDNRVYFLRDGVEYVLYDFTAEPGDTVKIFAGINNYPQDTTYTHVVTGKDTLENGACRMLLEVVFPEETTTATNAEKVWLAGLGSVDGIVHNAAKRTSNAHAAPSRTAHSSDTQTSVMLCAWREDSCLYTTNHPEYDTFGCVYNQDPTAVEDISTSQSSYQKIIREGQFLILHNGKTYSVMGIEL